MAREAKLTRLEQKYGRNAVFAYKSLGRLLLKTREATALLAGINREFKRYGHLPVAAALHLHARQTIGMARLVHTRRPKIPDP